MKGHSRWRIAASVAASLTAATLAGATAPAASAATTATAYSGDAYAVGISGLQVGSGINLLGLHGPLLSVSDTRLVEEGPFNGATPRSGDTSLLSVNASLLGLGAIATTAQSVVTEGNDASSASSTVQSADVSVGTVNLVHAVVLRSQTAVSCSGTGSASATILHLVVAGITLNVNVSPNSTITLRSGLFGLGPVIARVTINQQPASNSNTSETENAVVVSFPANGALSALIQGTITIAHAHSDVTCATVTPAVTPVFFFGYADNYRGEVGAIPGGTPTPWQGSPNVQFVGCGSGPAPCPTDSQGNIIYDAGAVRIDNPSTTGSVTVSAPASGQVVIGQCTYNPWPTGTTWTIPPGGTLILTQTGGPPPACPGGGEVTTGGVASNNNFNLDTSESNATCVNNGQFPMVHLNVNGVPTTLTDNKQIMNTGGVDRGNCPAGTNEATQWTAPGPTGP